MPDYTVTAGAVTFTLDRTGGSTVQLTAMDAIGQFFIDLDKAMRRLGDMMADCGCLGVPPEASDRARAYLIAHLTPEQREMFERRQFFLVQAKRYRWRITPRLYGVHRLGRSGRCRGVYCVMPREALPIYDVMLAQKLMLETNEDGFLAIANHRRSYKSLTYL